MAGKQINNEIRKNHSYVFWALYSVLIWGSLGVITTFLTHLPLFFILGVAFTVSGLGSIFTIRSWKVPFRILLLGIYGIFGFHICYVLALGISPPIEANLIVDVWPLLIVLLTPVILKTYKLSTHHILGAVLGFAGAGLIVTGGKLSLDFVNLPGYTLALLAGIIWSTYSVLTKKMPTFPTSVVGAFCLISGILSFVFHFAFEPAADPKSTDWIFLLLMGLGPMGSAFFTWDHALKKGDPQIIGALSYLIPLVATVLLATFGEKELTWVSVLAMVLIIVGAIIGSRDLFSSVDKDTQGKT